MIPQQWSRIEPKADLCANTHTAWPQWLLLLPESPQHDWESALQHSSMQFECYLWAMWSIYAQPARKTTVEGIFLRVDLHEAYIALHSAELTSSLPSPSVDWLVIRTAGGCGPRETSTLEHREYFGLSLLAEEEDRLWDTILVNLPVRYMPPVKQNTSWISKAPCTTVCRSSSASTTPLCLWWAEICRNTERKAEKCLREFSSVVFSCLVHCQR